MKQIRIAWVVGCHASREAGVLPREGTDWVVDDVDARHDMAVLIASGNQVCGAGSHWLEERSDALGAPPKPIGQALTVAEIIQRLPSLNGGSPTPVGSESGPQRTGPSPGASAGVS